MSEGNGGKITPNTAVSLGLVVVVASAVIGGSMYAGALAQRLDNAVERIKTTEDAQRRGLELNAAISEKLGEISATLRAMDSRLMRIERDSDSRRGGFPP